MNDVLNASFLNSAPETQNAVDAVFCRPLMQNGHATRTCVQHALPFGTGKMEKKMQNRPTTLSKLVKVRPCELPCPWLDRKANEELPSPLCLRYDNVETIMTHNLSFVGEAVGMGQLTVCRGT